ncbi:hypothetical protein [Psychroserpens mesophilus]|uniref:hypothetical protein n=1 Tax=Psychroserpens mesophilus TaxID=325473 RepID=UPI003D6488B4
MILNSEKQITIEFCQYLGELFYAIASVDNFVRDEEFKKLEGLMATEWLALDGFDTSSKNILIDTFKKLQNTDGNDAEVCYNNFINYKKEHEAVFNNNIKSMILKTAAKITSSFSGQNKSELVMLANLNIELKK